MMVWNQLKFKGLGEGVVFQRYHVWIQEAWIQIPAWCVLTDSKNSMLQLTNL